MESRQAYDLFNLISEKRIAAHDQPFGPSFHEAAKGTVYLARRARPCNVRLQPEGMCCVLEVSDFGRSNGVGRVNHKANMDALGCNSCNMSSLFPASSAVRTATPVMLPSGRLKLVTRPD